MPTPDTTKPKVRLRKQPRPATASASSLALQEPSAAYFVRNTEIPTNERLREQIRDFQSFLVRELWTLAKE
jgi:hypothetical protein